MGYREQPVPPRWRGLAECVWTSTAPAAPEVIDVLPDGCMDLVWSGAELFVAGPDTAPHPYERAAGLAATGLRFHPGVLPALLGVPAAALRDARVPLDALHPDARPARRRGDGRRVATRAPVLHRARRPAARRRARSPGSARPRRGWRGAPRPPRPRTRSAGPPAPCTGAASPRSATGRPCCAGCCGSVGRSRCCGRASRPAEVAARAGYADQPHLSREVRAFAGVSPARLALSHPE